MTASILKKTLGLSLADKLIVARIVMLAATVEMGLRLLSLPQLARMLRVRLEFGERLDRSTPPSPESEAMRHDARLVRAVLRRWPFGDTCLRRVLILACLTRDSSPVVRIGVSLPEGEFAAHAWLEIDGVAVDDSLSRQFVPLTR